MDERFRSQSSVDEAPALSPTFSGEFYDPSYSVWPGEIRTSPPAGRRPPRIISSGVNPHLNQQPKPLLMLTLTLMVPLSLSRMGAIA